MNYSIASVPNYKNNKWDNLKVYKSNIINELVEELKNDRHYHSIIYDNNSLYTFYFDVDKYAEIDPIEYNKLSIADKILRRESNMESFNTEIKHLVNVLRVETDVDISENDIKYTVNDNYKFGFHISIPKLHGSVSDIKALANIVHINCFDGKVDMSVYRSRGLYRLPNQSKGNSDKGLHIIINGSMKDFIPEHIIEGSTRLRSRYETMPKSSSKQHKVAIGNGGTLGSTPKIEKKIIDDEDYSISPNDSSNDISDISSEITYSELEINNTYKRIKIILGLLKEKRYNNYDNWIEIGMIIYNELGEQGFDLFDNFSKKGKRYKNSNDLRIHWKTFKDDEMQLKHGKKKMGSLVDWAKEDSPKEFKREERERKKREEKEAEDANYEEFIKDVEEFEKNHCKIMSKCIYIRCHKDKIYFLKEEEIDKTYKHLSYKPDPKKRFIKKWLEHDDIRRYEDIDCYPDRSECPDDCFNTWTDYYVDSITDYVENIEARDLILGHILIMCGNNKNCYEYVLRWIAHLLKHPNQKAHMLTFLSEQGAGKGCFMKLLERLIGTQKYFQTTQPDRDVWGKFNGIMMYKMLVNINELEKKQALDADGKIKGLITDDSIIINQKNINQVQIKSYHRFIATTNNLETIKVPPGDRRNVIMKCSDELIGNKEYFIKIFNFLNDDNVIKTMGEYFKKIEVRKDFLNENIPKTEIRDDLIDLSLGPYRMWLNSFCLRRSGIVDIYCLELYNDFNRFIDNNRLEYKNISLIKFSKNIVYTKHVSKGNKDKKGSHVIIDTDAVKKDMGIDMGIDSVSNLAQELSV